MLAPVLLGFATGCRTMLPMEFLCWMAYARLLHVQGTWAFWVGNIVSAIVFTVLAAGELYVDKLPQTPSRIAIGPLLARLTFGALVGAIVFAPAHAFVIPGAIEGALAALAGAFAGFHLRRWLVNTRGLPALIVALMEDVCVAILCLLALPGLLSR